MAYLKDERYDEQTTAAIAEHYKEILRLLGEDPEREGLVKTPERVAKALQFLTHGAHQDGAEILRSAMFKEEYQQMVLVKDIELYSTCEHHLQPFFGTISIGYLPKGRVLGISKLARLVEVFARRLQIQEKLVAEIADSLMETLEPHGVMVVCKAKHMCISSRGIEKHNAVMVTSAIRGAFKKLEVRSEFLEMIK